MTLTIAIDKKIILSIMTPRIMALSIMTLSIELLCITKHNIMGQIAKLSITFLKVMFSVALLNVGILSECDILLNELLRILHVSTFEFLSFVEFDL